MRWLKEGQKQENGDIMVVGEPSILHSAAGHYVGQLYLHFYKDMRPDEQGIPMPYDRLSEYFPNEESAAPLLESIRKENADNQDDYYPEGYTPLLADYYEHCQKTDPRDIVTHPEGVMTSVSSAS